MAKFYKTTVSIDILSEEPIEELGLKSLAFEIDQGELVGGHLRFERVELTPKQAADELYAVGSEPGFFQLRDDGSPQ